ncbi:hypothetical protein MASR1M31_07030 [Porphyromonadaceae bacterium]
MKKSLLITVLIAAFTIGAKAQTENRFGGQIEVGYGFRMGQKLNVFQVSLMPGYHFGPNIFAGVGIGFNRYSGFGGSLSSVPFFAHGTINLIYASTWTPFFATKIGYGIGKESETLQGTTNELKTGLYFAPSIGVKYKITPQQTISLALQYDAMAFKAIIRDSGDNGTVRYSGSTTNNALGVRVGYEF